MSEFFDDENEYPVLVSEILKLSKKLNKDSLESVISIMKNLKK